MTKLLLMTFYDFLIRHFKKHKKSCFLKSEKKRKIRILEHCVYDDDDDDDYDDNDVLSRLRYYSLDTIKPTQCLSLSLSA